MWIVFYSSLVWRDFLFWYEHTFVSNECAASMREIKNRQGKEELVNICIPCIIYLFYHAEFAGEVLQRGRLDQRNETRARYE